MKDFLDDWLAVFSIVIGALLLITGVCSWWFWFLITVMAGLIILAFGLHLVPTGYKAVVVFFGRRLKVIDEGLAILPPWPFFDVVKIDCRKRFVDLPEDTVLSGGFDEAESKEKEDQYGGVNILVNAMYEWSIVEPSQFLGLQPDIYSGVDAQSKPNSAMDQRVISEVRTMIASMTVEGALSLRNNSQAVENKLAGELNCRLKIFAPEETGPREVIGGTIQEWGIKIEAVRLKDILPDPGYQKKMEARTAMILDKQTRAKEAEADKVVVITNAEAALAKAQKEAEAVRVTADANRHKREQEAAAEAEYLKRQIAAFVGKQPDKISIEDAQLYAQFQAALQMAKSLDQNSTVILPQSELGGLVGQFMGLLGGMKKTPATPATPSASN